MQKLSQQNRQVVAISLILLLLSCCCVSVYFLNRLPTSNQAATVNNSSSVLPDAEASVKAVQTAKLYPVTAVVDGDTIKVDIDGTVESVRLIGIDTPELHHPTKPVQCFAQQASDKATEILSGKQVSLEADSTQGDRDAYDRLLRYVFLSDGSNFNKYMIAQGYAYEYTYNSIYKYQSEFREAQTQANSADLGLWGGVCACDKGAEVKRECSGCNQATVYYSNWDCSTYSENAADSACGSLCPAVAPAPTYTAPVPTYTPPAPSGYACNCSKTCGAMTCDEAYFQLNSCGCGARDGDNDGVPCESVCPGG